MKIVFTGSQGTGKTTLAKHIAKEYQLPFKGDLVKNIKNFGSNFIDINKNLSDCSQILIAHEYWKLLQEDSFVSDRCLLDVFVYTMWGHYEYGHRISKDVFNFIKTLFEKHINDYDYIFYIEPGLKLELNGYRDTDKIWQRTIDLYFKKIIEQYKLNVITIKNNNFNERIQIVKNVLKNI